MRARQPDRADVVERNGVKVAYEVFGAGEPALLLIPAVADQPRPVVEGARPVPVPPLHRRHRRRHGATARPTGPHGRSCYAPAEVVADLLAVLDAVGLDPGGRRRPLPCRAVGAAIGRRSRPTGCRVSSPSHRPSRLRPRDEHCGGADRALGGRDRRPHRLGHVQPPLLAAGRRLPALVEFFFDQLLPEPHSTKQYEDTVAWALDTDRRGDDRRARRPGRTDGPARRPRRCAGACGVPALVIHGTEDRCQPVARGRRLAELTGGELVVLEGAGHLPHGREPVKVNRLVTEFVDRDRRGNPCARQVWTRGLHRPEAGAVPLVADRARSRPPRRRRRQGAEATPPGTRDRLARPASR